MNKALLFLLGVLFCASGLTAQCSGCTTSISNTTTSAFLVSAGQKLCITPTGSVTGVIAVNGGTLCNYGNINTSKVWIYNGGFFYNYGTGDIDSLLVQDNTSQFDNYGSSIHVRFATILNATSNNYSTITTDYIGDSIAVIKNYGNINVNFDLYNSGIANFQNLSYMKINGSFYNATPANFYTTCKISVAQNWYNSGTIVGSSGCAGFNIAGFSANSGTVGPLPSLKIDICDAGSPTSFDLNSGNIANTTFCACTNSCVLVSGVKESSGSSLSKNLYPNPCPQKCITEYQENVRSVNVYNELGQVIKLPVLINENKVEITSENLKAGIYFVETTSASGKTDRQKLIVE